MQSTGPAVMGALKRYKMLVFALVISNVALGLFSAYLLRQLDHNYSQLLDQSWPAVTALRAVGRESVNVYHLIVNGLVDNDPVRCAETARKVRATQVVMQAARAQAADLAVLRERPRLLEEMLAAGKAYDAAIESLLPHINPQSTAESERGQLVKLESGLERCRAVNNLLLDFVEERSQSLSDDFSAATRHRSFWVVGAGTWPVVLAALAVAVTIGIVIVMLFMFRRTGDSA